MKNLRELLLKIEARDNKGKLFGFDKTTAKIAARIIACNKKKSKVMIIGNGGSASIASHIVTDMLKNAKVRALAFNDISLVTCLSNDLGYEQVFSYPISMLADKGDILFAISSSGKSRNILNAVEEAKDKGCFVVTLSGFNRDNPLRAMGDINFYAPSHAYGDVEIVHMAICHYIVDRLE